MGRHHELWDGDEDPRDVFERLLGIKPAQLPANVDVVVKPITEEEEN